MADNPEFRFKINAFTPETLPMERLAAYMAELAKLLGSPAGVNFVRMDTSSAVLVSKANDREERKIGKRIELVRMGGGPTEARSAYQKLDDMLFEDGTDGVLERGINNLLFFPGKVREVPIVWGPVVQEDTIDGYLISLGGRDASINVHLSDGHTIFKCQTSRAMARSMAPHIFGPMIRVFGEASWRREATGDWKLNSMTITDFAPLNDDSAAEVIARLRAIEGNDWDKVADPYMDLREIRGREEDT